MSYSSKPIDYYRAHTFSQTPVPSTRTQNVNSWPSSLPPNTWQFQSQHSSQQNYGAFSSSSYEQPRNGNSQLQTSTAEPIQIPNIPMWPMTHNDSAQPIPPNQQSFNNSNPGFSPPSIAGFNQQICGSPNDYPRVPLERYNSRRTNKANYDENALNDNGSRRVDSRRGKERVLRACACGHFNHIRKNHCDQCGRAKAPPKKRNRKPSSIEFGN